MKTLIFFAIMQNVSAGMVELADTQDLGSCAERCTGSTPATRTSGFSAYTKKSRKKETLRKEVVLLGFHKITAAERCQNSLPPLS